MTVKILEITDQKLVNIVSKYDANNDGKLDDDELQSVFTELQSHHNRKGEIIGSLCGGLYGYGAIAVSPILDEMFDTGKILKGVNKTINNKTINSINSISTLVAALGVAALGWFIGKKVDENRNLKIENYIQELKALDRTYC